MLLCMHTPVPSEFNVDKVNRLNVNNYFALIYVYGIDLKTYILWFVCIILVIE